MILHYDSARPKHESTLAGKAPSSAARRLAWRYYGAMLSAGAVAAVLGGASAYTAGSAAFLPKLLAWIGVLLVGLNFAGAAIIYRPIRRRLAGDAGADARFQRRAALLPMLSGLWVFGLTAVAMLGDAAVARGSWQALAQPSGALLGATVHGLVFAGYLGIFSYLLALDHLISLRESLWRDGQPLALPRRRFVMRLIGALAAVGIGPVLIALSDQWSHPISHSVGDGLTSEPRDLSQYLHQTLHMDVLGALLLAVMVAVLVARGLSRPLDILLAAMRRVDEGDLATKAPVVSDDEFGVLTQRFNRMLEGLNERERLRRTFAHFVPESIAAALIADGGAIEPQEREATVLFVDIEQFTRIAATLAPREVVVLLNGYFGEVADVIHRYSGVITQFQGDAVLASFNLPATDPDHARHALEAAMEMQQRIVDTVFHGGVRLRSRIGIATGLVVGGTVGGGERLGYTVHGDTVNLASRLEELNKELGTRILLSARTAELLGTTAAMRDLGTVSIRGFDKPLRIFEPAAGDQRLRQERERRL